MNAFRGLSALVSPALCALLVACVAIAPPVTVPLGKSQEGKWTPAVEYRPGVIGKYTPQDEALILVAISGGGKRSASFSYGVLKELNGVSVDIGDGEQPLLHKVDLIAGVSGGSFTAAYYALHRDAMFAKSELDCSYENFLREDTGARIWGLYLLPWNWGWALTSSYDSNDVMAQHYAERLFQQPSADLSKCATPFADAEHPNGATFADLAARGLPLLMIGGTDVTTGQVFPFYQGSFDLLCADISKYPLAWAVAASNGFAPVLSSMPLENHNGSVCPPNWKPKWNPWLDEVSGNAPEQRADEEPDETFFTRKKLLADVAVRAYLQPVQGAHYAHIADGGVTDNLALRGMTDWITMHGDDPLVQQSLVKTRRILLIMIDGQSSLDSRIAGDPKGPGFIEALAAMVSTSVDQQNIETKAAMQAHLKELAWNIQCERGQEPKAEIVAAEVDRRLGLEQPQRQKLDPAKRQAVEHARRDELMREIKRRMRCESGALSQEPPVQEIVSLTLGEVCDRKKREELLQVETGLGIDKDRVDELIAAGQEVARRHVARIRSILDFGLAESEFATVDSCRAEAASPPH